MVSAFFYLFCFLLCLFSFQESDQCLSLPSHWRIWRNEDLKKETGPTLRSGASGIKLRSDHGLLETFIRTPSISAEGQTSRGLSNSIAELHLVSIAVPAMESSNSQADETSNGRTANSQQLCGGTMVPQFDREQSNDPANVPCDPSCSPYASSSIRWYDISVTSPHLTPHLPGSSLVINICPLFQRAPTRRWKVKRSKRIVSSLGR